jgi:hypothetical protein
MKMERGARRGACLRDQGRVDIAALTPLLGQLILQLLQLLVPAIQA